ncbi:MAG TPA: hypothetical protein PLD10_04860 [Rhodopila sp.]|nr:hypothetical protein [Rhodopila sp.]
MPVIQLPTKRVCGLSFTIADLILLRSWAEANSLRMVVRQDHGVETEEYEEVLAFSQGESALCRWIMWRDANAVFVQPLIGRPQLYDTVADAMNALSPKQTPTLTDITATHWPT